MDDLFTRDTAEAFRPLADRMRPRSLDEYSGQQHILGINTPLRRAIEQDKLHSMVFWGPPGTGKTSLAALIAAQSGASLITLSAVLSGVKDIREAVDRARQLQAEGKRALLFIDEVHRFNKAQQDAFLPHVEEGLFVFIGATTENPSFELNNALLSRVRVYVLQSLTDTDLQTILRQALGDSVRGLGQRQLQIADDDLALLAAAVDGDARRALNLLEVAADFALEHRIAHETVLQVTAGRVRRFDKGGEAFYDQISALHKSVRGSAPDAALYWLARMLDGGCDPLYIARRLIRMASEDIGNADPRALTIARDACDVMERLGSPEGELALAQAVVYLAVAAKSNAVYSAFAAAKEDARNAGSLDVPLHLRNAPTALMRSLDYGTAYRYAHDEPDAYAAGEEYFPAELRGRRYYHPVNRGLEIEIAKKLAKLAEKDAEARSATTPSRKTDHN